jgi:toxin HigB-1
VRVFGQCFSLLSNSVVVLGGFGSLFLCLGDLNKIAWVPCYYAIMIQSFASPGTEDIFNGIDSRIARKTCPQCLWKVAFRKLDQLDSVTTLEELKIPPGNNLEALKGERKGQCSIRINDQYRICFVWKPAGPDDVEIVDYH